MFIRPEALLRLARLKVVALKVAIEGEAAKEAAVARAAVVALQLVQPEVLGAWAAGVARDAAAEVVFPE